ncbi:sigma-70 family RNA polymerase sigma factor, partial [Planctomycetota bacterium]
RKDRVLRSALEHRSALFSYIMAVVRDPDEAEELFQDVYLIICNKWDTFTLGTDLKAWVWGITRLEIKKRVQKLARRPRPRTLDLFADVLSRTEGPDRWEQEKDALEHCLNASPDRARKAMISYYIDGRRTNAVAEKLGVSVAALYKLLSRTRDMLADCIRERLTVGGNA